MAVHQEHETDTIRMRIEKKGSFYHINGWMRASKRHGWKHVIIEHVHISYLAAHNEFTDHGVLNFHYKNQFSVISDAA